MFPAATRSKRPKSFIDPELLKVEHGVKPPPLLKAHYTKFGKLIAAMRPGSCIRCESSEVDKVAAAVRKSIATGSAKHLQGCKTMTRSRCEDGHGRVWAVKGED